MSKRKCLRYLYKSSLAFILATLCSCGTQKNQEICSANEQFLPSLDKLHQENLNSSSDTQINRIYYLIQSGQIQQAIDLLLNDKKQDPYVFHSSVAQQLGMMLLENGAKSQDPVENLLALHGASISQDERALHLVAPLVNSEYLDIQLVALHVLASFESTEADRYIEECLSSPFIATRIEAAYILAVKKHPRASLQIEALMQKLDPSLWAYFPQLFAIDGQPESIRNLKRLLSQSKDDVRVEAILAVAATRRDDILNSIRMIAQDISPKEQEAAAFALASLGDENSRGILTRLTKSNVETTALAAHFSLYQLGDLNSSKAIAKLAENNNLFALSLLGKIPGYEDLLIRKIHSDKVNVRVNAALALLQRGDARCQYGLEEILVYDPRDLGFQLSLSPGGSLSYWEVIPSSSQRFKDQPLGFELTTRMKEQVLIQARDLNEEAFLNIAHCVLSSYQRELIPQAIRLLESLNTPGAIALLEKGRQQLGAPLTRQYCNLALYRLKQSSVYAQELLEWVKHYQNQEVIQARPYVPWQYRSEQGPYNLTLRETSQLLIECYQTLAATKNEAGLESLLKAIRDGNPKNRPLLGGLFMRSIQ